MPSYVNDPYIITLTQVDKASLKPATAASGEKGRHFDMPLCLGPKKTGSDKAGGPCSVWDFVVNPETIKMADATPAIKKVLIETVRAGAGVCVAGHTTDRPLLCHGLRLSEQNIRS